MKSLEKPLTEKESQDLEAMMRSDRLMERLVERAVRGRRNAGRKARKFPELLDRITQILWRRALRASQRSPESLLDELDDLNLVLELRGRILGGHGSRRGRAPGRAR